METKLTIGDVGYEFHCKAHDCRHNEALLLCARNHPGDPTTIGEGGRCLHYERLTEAEMEPRDRANENQAERG